MKTATAKELTTNQKGRGGTSQSPRSKTLQANESCRVDFQLYDPQACNVFLAGTFNDWNPGATPLHRQPDGKWTTAIKLKPGRYEYKFVVDGNWQADPMSWQSVRNPFDGFNSVLDVQMIQG